ncbi:MULTISPECIES: efflux RND transporter permease subunit [unclassified Paraburkholderia]|uniref:efflux RND transporter permease subunit n=1 Tax=unclassified Paraburkholderia TaxID=2615204 RepID=UPI001607BF79|nr:MULTISPECIES: CusA/CzcA family heavy metal efflux RND transporter [unclassified Paraburkholderia]MBB5443686.1 cobalt-zinc-cadmium resistance protein CzcA [Paraburkholderia sp. WSM4177]MBB5485187.1 cobalt-zinc-cadmium resistance protein CzcA [Paraburkholderia sp. WSM4180]
MITKIVDAALKNRAMVLILVAVLIAFGLVSMQRLPFDAQPDISPVQVLVTTQAPGLAPVDIERSITAPVELALQGLPGMQALRSISRYGLSVIYVRFADGSNIYQDRNLIGERLQTVQLPPGTNSPQMGPLSDGLSEIYQFQVRGHGQSLMTLRTLLDWQIAPKFREVPGVVDVNVNGGELKTYEVQVADDALTRYGLSTADIFNAVQMNNGATGGATIEHNGGEAIIRGEGLLRNATDIGNIVLRTEPDGTPLYVRNVARVVEAPMPRLGAVTRDGQGEAVVGVVLMGLGQNTRIVAQRVQDAVKEINRTLPPGVEIAPYYNRADLMNRVLHTVAHNMVEGAVLVIAVLLLLLGNARAGLIVALAIPLSMLAAAIAMYSAGMSGNLMSLGAIDFGLLVDGAVVMIENIVRRRAEAPARPMRAVVLEASREVARPVTFAVLIITAVYLPILSLQGVEGKMFRPMALTVVFALLASLVITLTVMPVLASFLLRGKVAEHESRIIHWIRRRYEPVLTRAAHRPVLTIGLAVLLLALAGVLGSRLGAEFLPRLEEGALTVTTTKLPGISVPSAVESQTMVERTLMRFPEVQSAVTLGGSSEIPTDPMGVEQSDTFIMLKPKSEWKTAQTQEGLVEAYSDALNRAVPGLTLDWAQPIQMRMDDMLAGVQADVAVMIHGNDLDALHDTAQRIASVIARVPGAADVQAQQTVGQPYLRIIVNRDAVARYGLNASQVLDVVQALGGRTVGSISNNDGRFDIRVRLTPQDRTDVARIGALRVSNGTGKAVPLAEVADIRMEPGPSTIEREEGQRVIMVQANVRGRDLAGFVLAAQHAVATQVKLPPGYSLSWNGSFKNLQEAMSRLYVVVPVALAVIFVLLYLMFDSVSLAALIFFNVPFAAIGGILALWTRGLPFSISAAVGFIALFGIAVLNGVVLVSYIVEKRASGLGAIEAARQAALTRLRPVLMTATVASLGFLPMAFSTSSGAEVQRPLATVVIGGLISATLLTLLVLPSLYPWFDRRKRTVPQEQTVPEYAE